jgi:DNA-binding SARP family transcriptional activator
MAAPLSLRFLGEPGLWREGVAVPLPQSRKTRALLAYLAVTGRRHRRERLCSLLWELPDDPRGALRWSLSKLRALVDEPGTTRIVTDRESVLFERRGVEIDLIDLRQRLAGGIAVLPTDPLIEIAGAFRGEFLEGLEMVECHDFHAWCIAEREEARASRAAILSVLLDRLKDRPEAALPHARALVELRPHDELAWARLVRLLAAAGRRREAEEQCELGMRVMAEAGGAATGPLQKAWRNLRKSQGKDSAASHALAPERIPGSAGPEAALQQRWPSVGVLPLRGVGSDVVLPHLADAITEDLVTSLSRDRNMVVIAHGLGQGAPHASLDPREIARQIGAHYMKAVSRLDDTLVVAARLIDAVEAKHIWAERSVQKLDARLQIDDQLARKLAAALRGEIESAEAAKAESDVSGSLDVRASYHLGLRELYRFTEAGLAAAQAHFERALRLDPDFAALHARLAYVHIQRYWYGSPASRAQALENALAAARKAVALDPKDALGHFAMGRALALRRRFDLAIPNLEMAVRLDPTLAQGYFGLGQASWYAGLPKEAIRILETAIELNPHDPHLWSFYHDQSEAYFALGLLAEAERAARAAARLPNATHWPWVTLTSVLGAANKREEAAEALSELLRRRPDYSLRVATSDFSHLTDQDFVYRYLEGLRTAGLP